jgi:hypothetical protein
VNGLRVNGLVPEDGAFTAVWPAKFALPALAGARPRSRSVLAIASVRTIANTAAIAVTVIALGRWGR